MRRIFMSPETINTPVGLRDGELVEAVRIGGPRDGDTIGYFRVRLLDDGDELDLQPVDREDKAGAA